MSAGILCEQQLRDLIDKERITRPSGELCDVDASSIDLPLGDEYWEMKGSCRAGRGFRVADALIPRYAQRPDPIKNSGETELMPGNVYVFKADCRLNLKGLPIYGKATGKSSIGRLDILVRLLVDNSDSFDTVPRDYEGALYIEVTPITFPLLVRPGTCLSQLRLSRGPDVLSALSLGALALEDGFPVVDKEGRPLLEPCDESSSEVFYPFSLDLTPSPGSGFSAFVARKREDLPSGTAIDPTKKGFYDADLFWEGKRWDNMALQLEMDRLYILRSRERLRIPLHLALECKSYTETMGEWRIEYAGFAHPFFGFNRPEGAPIIFEVRGHNIPTLLTDGIPLGNVVLRRMSRPAEEPEEAPSYEHQELVQLAISSDTC